MASVYFWQSILSHTLGKYIDSMYIILRCYIRTRYLPSLEILSAQTVASLTQKGLEGYQRWQIPMVEVFNLFRQYIILVTCCSYGSNLKTLPYWTNAKQSMNSAVKRNKTRWGWHNAHLLYQGAGPHLGPTLFTWAFTLNCGLIYYTGPK